jgi:hypothetical protein
MTLDKKSRVTVTDEFVELVKSALPIQPWKPGIHHVICKQLQCQAAEYYAAVDRLMEDGTFLRQKDGVLFDAEGNVVAVDPERVDPQTLELYSRISSERG